MSRWSPSTPAGCVEALALPMACSPTWWGAPTGTSLVSNDLSHIEHWMERCMFSSGMPFWRRWENPSTREKPRQWWTEWSGMPRTRWGWRTRSRPCSVTPPIQWHQSSIIVQSVEMFVSQQQSDSQRRDHLWWQCCPLVCMNQGCCVHTQHSCIMHTRRQSEELQKKSF